jgi:hypothetical protein
MSKVIMSCFAGRKKNLDILIPYVNKLIEKGLVSEFHLWNFTRNMQDDTFLKSLFNPTEEPFCVSDYRYCSFPTKLYVDFDTSLTLYFRAQRDVHIGLIDPDSGNVVNEIVLGGWTNSKCIVRKYQQGESLIEKKGKCILLDSVNTLTLSLKKGTFVLGLNGVEKFLTFESEAFVDGKNFEIKVAGWDADIEWYNQKPKDIDVLENGPMKLFHVRNKRSWLEYYHHYTEDRYPDSILIKCDDDIVFIDIHEFKQFIERRKQNPEYFLAFPSIINNGVCAHYQQQAHIIPYELGYFPYDTECGFLWGDGKVCEKLHTYFIENYNSVIEKTHNLPIKVHKLGDRISINFFAILSKDFHIFRQIGRDDEKELSMKMPVKHKRNVYVDQSFIVSHLGFFKQRETGLDEPAILEKYAQLAKEYIT